MLGFLSCYIWVLETHGKYWNFSPCSKAKGKAETDTDDLQSISFWKLDNHQFEISHHFIYLCEYVCAYVCVYVCMSHKTYLEREYIKESFWSGLHLSRKWQRNLSLNSLFFWSTWSFPGQNISTEALLKFHFILLLLLCQIILLFHLQTLGGKFLSRCSGI